MASGEEKKRPLGEWRDVLLLVVGALLAHVLGNYSYDQAVSDSVESARIERSIELYRNYEELGTTSVHAARFLEGDGGQSEDLLLVYRHFRELATLVVNGDAEADKIADLYSGRLLFWGTEFSQLDVTSARLTEKIRPESLGLMRELGSFLLVLSRRSGSPDDQREVQRRLEKALDCSPYQSECKAARDYQEYASASDTAEGAADAVRALEEYAVEDAAEAEAE